MNFDFLARRPVKTDGTSTFKPPPDDTYEYSSVVSRLL